MTIPTQMQAMVLTGHGGPDKLVWREDVPVPRPAPGEVLIRVGAAALNNTDINTRIGWYAPEITASTDAATGGQAPAAGGWNGALHFPRIQGADVCGRIAAVGAGVDPARIGQRVLLRPMYQPGGDEAGDALATFGSERDGGFAQYCTADAREAYAIDSPLSDEDLASFPCAWSTAEGMIQRADLGADLGAERVLITGASGGVGSAAVQLARRRGAQITAVTTPAKAEALRALGAHHVIDRTTPPPAQGFDVVLDLVGGPGWPGVLNALDIRGRYVASGAIAGPLVQMDLRQLYLRDLTVMGSTRQPRKVFSDLIGYIERGEVRPLVSARYALRDLHAAQEAFLSKAHPGKIVLRVDAGP